MLTPSRSVVSTYAREVHRRGPPWSMIATHPRAARRCWRRLGTVPRISPVQRGRDRLRSKGLCPICEEGGLADCHGKEGGVVGDSPHLAECWYEVRNGLPVGHVRDRIAVATGAGRRDPVGAAGVAGDCTQHRRRVLVPVPCGFEPRVGDQVGGFAVLDQ